MPLVSNFGNAQLTTLIGTNGLGQIILSADELGYIFTLPAARKVIKTSLDGTTSSVLFTLNNSIAPFNANSFITGITYNPSKTKFMIVLAGTTSYPSTNNYVVEVNLDGTNPIIKMDDNTPQSEYNPASALACPQCITLTSDQQYYLITMYASYIENPESNSSGAWTIVKVPVDDMSNPVYSGYQNNSALDNTVAPQQLCYTPTGNLLFPGYNGNSIRTIRTIYPVITLTYTAASLGISLPWGPRGMIQTKDGSGYLITGYNSKNIKLLKSSGPISIAGAWRQIDAGSSKSFVYYQRRSFDPNVYDTAWTIAGSNDQISWFIVDRASSQNTYGELNYYGDPTGMSKDVGYPDYSYRYYRYILEKMSVATTYIMSGGFGWFTDTDVLTYDASFTQSTATGDVSSIETQSPSFPVRDAYNNSYTTYQYSDNYNTTGVYTGTTTTLVYDPLFPSPPLAPTDLVHLPYTSASEGNNSFRIGWTPGSDVGNPITSYNYSIDNGVTWTGSLTTNPATINVGVTNGNTYNIKLRAVTIGGAGTASNSLSVLVGTTNPPTDLVATSGNGSLSISFTPGLYPTATITNYKYSVNGGTYTALNPVDAISPVTIPTLTNGQSYSIRLKAFNTYGDGFASDIVTGMPSTVPDAPTGLSSSVTATSGVISATISFTPGFDQGSAIINYSYSLNNGTFTSLNPAQATSPITISNLSTAQTYQIKIRAINANGEGAESAAVSATTPVPPTAPTNLVQIPYTTSTAGQNRARISFTAGYDATGTVYNEYSLNNGSTWVGISTSTNVYITGLTNGQSYNIILRSVNSATRIIGLSSAVFVITAGRTNPPTSLSAAAGNATATISFTAGTFPTTTITNYIYSINNGVTYTPLSPVDTTSPVTIPDLTNGRSYSIILAAFNAYGNGLPSSAVSVTPSGPNGIPSAPTGLTVTVGTTTATISFTPGFNGGNAIENYKYSINNGTSYSSAGTITSPITISGLTPGQTYPIKLRAVNSIGDGTESTSINATPLIPPGAPTINSISIGNGTATVYFTAGSDGGNVITDYQYSTDGSTYISAGITSPFTISNLVNGQTYPITLRAVNVNGNSAISNMQSAVLPALAPAAPTINSISVGNKTATVYFTLGSSNGNAITGLKYSINNGVNNTDIGTTSPFTISNLNNGQTYPITLRAVNSVGPGDISSVANAVLPSLAPDAPTINSITAGNRTVSVAFTPGSNNGSTITKYQYSTDNGSNYSDASGTLSPITISNLVNGQTYQIALRAVNGVGTSAASNIQSAALAAVLEAPYAPTITGIGISNRTATIFFSEPISDGGSPITDYQYSTDGSTYISAGTSSSITISNLNNGQTYPITLRAVNAIGLGDISTAVNAVLPALAPSQPTINSISVGNKTVTITFTPPLYNNGAAITKYQYSTDNGSNYSDASGTTSPITISVLNGQTYQIRIRAVNSIGSGGGSNPYITAVLPALAPDAPTITLMSVGQTSAFFHFIYGYNNGSAYTDFEYSIDGSTYISVYPNGIESFFNTITTPGAAVVNLDIPTVPNSPLYSLVSGQTYNVTLRGVNSIGRSIPSNSVSIVTLSSVPSAPTINSITVGNKTATVSFTAPSSDGGSAITKYLYSTNNGSTYSDTGTVSPFTISGLANGQTHPITLLAFNSVGNGTVSSAVNAILPALAPDVPTGLSATVGNKTATITFTPGSNNGAAITKYQYSTDSGATYLDASGTTSPVTVSLLNGQTYQIILRAVNSVGEGIASSTVNAVLPALAPDAPTINSVTVGNKTATVAFTPPLYDNGAAITDYQYSTNDGSTYSSAGTTSPLTISGLTNGQTYQIKLLAFNSVGEGIASSTVNAVLPALAPDAPTINSVTVGNKTATVAFTPGLANGSAFTGLKYSTDNGVNYTNIAFTTSPFTISNLLNGQTYQIKLISVNNIDDSVASSAFPAVLPARAPDAPIELTATRGNASVTINFTPRSNNGAAIRKYQYSIDDGNIYEDVDSVNTASSVTISRLTNGRSYTILLRAVNDIGDGDASSSVTATPSTAASAPSINSVTRGNNSLIVDFTPGSNGGDAISNYKYSVDGTTYYAFDPAITTSPATISLVNGTSLINGQSYDVTLLAVNTNGDGEVSNLLNGTPSSVPDAPTGLSATVGNTTATISFTPGFDQGSAILNYKYSTDETTYYEFNPAVTSSPVTISGLINDQSYNITLLATNANGDGAVSDIVVATPHAVAPNPPTGLSRSYAGSGMVSIYFTAGSDGGSPITNYEYSINGGTSYVALNPPDNTSPVTISGLTNGQSYTIQLRSVNLAGESIASSTITYTPTATFTQNHVCFLEGAMITCYDPESKQEIERVVQTLRKGDLVKTTMDGYKAVEVIGTSKIYNPPNSMRSMHRLYRCPKENYPELKKDLVLTGCHAILVSELSDDERCDLLQLQGKIYATEDYYRLIACCDKRTIPYELDGFFNIWHLALENENCHFNYGIYANGLKVETSSIYVMKERSGMTIM